MVFLTHALPALSLTTVLGIAGLVLGTASSLIGGRRLCLAVQAAGCGFFLIHYARLGASTGALMCMVCLVQMATAFPAERPRWSRALFLATLPAGLAMAALSWHGAMSALSVTGFLLGSLGRWQTSMAAMRGCYAAGSLFGAGHNILAGSGCGLLSDTLSLSGHLWSLHRIHARSGRMPALRGVAA